LPISSYSTGLSAGKDMNHNRVKGILVPCIGIIQPTSRRSLWRPMRFRFVLEWVRYRKRQMFYDSLVWCNGCWFFFLSISLPLYFLLYKIESNCFDQRLLRFWWRFLIAHALIIKFWETTRGIDRKAKITDRMDGRLPDWQNSRQQGWNRFYHL
jgi:hypothetical protein